MGAKFSRRRGYTTLPSTLQLNPIPNYKIDLQSYEAASKVDPQLQNFGATLQHRASNVINKLSLGVEVHALPMDSLREVTDILLEMNQQVVKFFLESKRDIWKNQDVFNLVGYYFENSLHTLDFCNVLKNCLQQAHDNQFIINNAIERFEEEGYEGALYELENFKASVDPFTEEFFLLFQDVYNQQVSTLQKLQAQEKKIGKRLKKFKTWRRFSNVIFVTAMVAILICSVVAAAITAPPVVAAMAAAAAVPIGSVGTWLNSVWKGYEDGLEGQREILSSMHICTYISIKDLDTIKALVNRLQPEILALVQSTDLAVQEENVANAKLVVKEIKREIGVFMKTIVDLVEHSERCIDDIKFARSAVLERIVRQPGY